MAHYETDRIESQTTIPPRFLAICMVLAPLLGLAGSLVGFQFAGTIEQEVLFIAENPDRYLASNALWIASAMVFVPATLGLLSLVPKRYSAWGLLGAALLFVGSFGHGLVISYTQPQVPLIESTLNQAAVTTFIATSMYDHSAFLVLLVPFLGFYLGLFVFAVVLWRANVAPVWVSALIVLALGLGFGWDHPAKNEVMFGLLTVTLGFLALKLWRPAKRQLTTETPA